MAIDYIHAMKVLHRDIKTQNVFFNLKLKKYLKKKIFLNRKMTIVKVGDFGISKVSDLIRIIYYKLYSISGT